MFWIEAIAEDGEEYSARWATATDAQQDAITAFIEATLGAPDTVA